MSLNNFDRVRTYIITLKIIVRYNYVHHSCGELIGYKLKKGFVSLAKGYTKYLKGYLSSKVELT